MDNWIVRIGKITINNFKNVAFGELNFENTRKNYQASVLGLYGQNGSGKTALIDAISLLKLSLCGMTIPVKYADYVNVGAEFAKIKYEFKVVKECDNTGCETEYLVAYEFCFKKEKDDYSADIDVINDTVDAYKLVLYDEVLSYSVVKNGKKLVARPFIDTRSGDVFGPKSKFDLLTSKNRAAVTDLMVEKKLSSAMAKSFIFSKATINTLKNNSKDIECVYILSAISDFGVNGLYIVDTSNVGLINSFNVIGSFGSKKEGSITIPVSGEAVIPQDMLDNVNKIVENMNIVLAQLVPGLKLSVKERGMQTLKNGSAGSRVQLMSNKNCKEIPLQYESEGIKKLIAIMQLLIAVYNNASFTVAIDELDSGVFEYLLGEILRIISEKGKGQLIFTSHNLRPLETIDRGFIAFTTTNPDKRYIRMSASKKNTNLRDFYYRDIVLGEQTDTVYDATDNSEIAFAFREAGILIGS